MLGLGKLLIRLRQTLQMRKHNAFKSQPINFIVRALEP